MKAIASLLALAGILTGLCVAWVDAGQSGIERRGETTVEHYGVRS